MTTAVTPEERKAIYSLMTPDQIEARAERVAIMVHDGKQDEEAAEAYCDTKSQMYGKRYVEEKQDDFDFQRFF